MTDCPARPGNDFQANPSCLVRNHPGPARGAPSSDPLEDVAAFHGFGIPQNLSEIQLLLFRFQKIDSGICSAAGNPLHNSCMRSQRAAADCPECKRIAREVSTVLGEVLRAGDDKAAWKKAAKRSAQILEAKQNHELRTGHRVPTRPRAVELKP